MLSQSEPLNAAPAESAAGSALGATNVRLTALLVLVGLAALASTFWRLDSWSLWGDEQYSWRLAEMSLHDMWFWTADDLHPPLYYAVMHVWVSSFGDGGVALRAPSAIAAALTAVLVAYLAFRLDGLRLAAVAAAFLILNPAHLHFAQEARMYPLVGLLAAISTIAFAALVSRPSARTGAVYVLAMLALVYTDYSGFILFGIHAAVLAAYALNASFRLRRHAMTNVAAAAGIAIVAGYAPWWRYFFDHAGQGAGPTHVVAPTWDSVVFTARDALGLERGELLWPVLAAFLLLFGLWGLWKRRDNPVAVAVAAAATVPICQLAISIVGNPVFDLKRVSPFIFAYSMISAVAMIEAGSLAARLLRVRNVDPLALAALPCALIATFMLLGSIDKYRADGPADWRSVDSILSGFAGPVYVWPAYNVELLRYYTGDSADLRYPARDEFLAAADGYAPIPRTAPGAGVAMVHGSTRPQDVRLLAALRPELVRYFDTTTTQAISPTLSVTFFAARNTASYNIELVSAKDHWTPAADGSLTLHRDGSQFKARFFVDLDGIDGVDEAFSLHVEYRDGGTAPLLLLGTDRSGNPTELAEAAVDGTGDWRTLDVLVPAGATLTNAFALSGDTPVRAIELRRYQLDGVNIVPGQWFVRPDGYVQALTANPCVTLIGDGHSDGNATITRLVSGAWVDDVVPMHAQSGRACFPEIAPRTVVRRMAASG